MEVDGAWLVHAVRNVVLPGLPMLVCLVLPVAGAQSPSSPAPSIHCAADEVAWNGGCFDRDEWRIEEKLCPDGVIQIPEDEELPRCTPCEEVDGQGPTNYCADLELLKADRALDRAYQNLLNDFPHHASELERAQSAWLKIRETTCERERKKYDGGSMAQMVYANCKHLRIRSRMQRLNWLRQRWSKR